MRTYTCTLTLRFRSVSNNAESASCFMPEVQDVIFDCDTPDPLRRRVRRELQSISSTPLDCRVSTEMPPSGDAALELRRQAPDRRPGQCRKFRFTHDALMALPPHPQEYRAGQTEYRDTYALGLCLSVGRTGRKHFHMRYHFRGKKRNLAIGDFPCVTLKEARGRVHEARAQIARDQDPAVARARKHSLPTLREYALGEYMPHAKLHKRSWKDDEARLKLEILPRFGELRLDDITTREVQQFYSELVESKSPSTANRYLALLRRMYSLANRWELYDGNPAKNVVKLADGRARERYLSREEIVRFLAALDITPNRAIAAGLRFLLFTGLRKSEALLLEWNRVDRETVTVYLADTKSGRPRTVYLNPLAAAVIEEMWESPSRDERWVFPGRRRARPIINPNKVFHEVCDRAGIEGLRIHDLRHSFASLAINGGASLYDVQKLLGHATNLMTQRYAHLDEASVRRATNMVGEQVERMVASGGDPHLAAHLSPCEVSSPASAIRALTSPGETP